MITVEDCRSKAAEWLDKAQASTDPITNTNMRRAADAWNALAEQIEQSALRQLRLTVPVTRPADLAKLRNSSAIDSVQVADLLRELLHLGDDTPE